MEYKLRVALNVIGLVLLVAGVVFSLMLTYRVLQSIGASESMWALFWAYIPCIFLGQFAIHIAKKG